MYQTLRSVFDNHVPPDLPGWRVRRAPDRLRQQGPWQVLRRGDITNLKRNYRLRLARDGYVLVHSELAVFKPEA